MENDMVARTRIGSSELEVAPLCLGGNVFGWTADRDATFGVLDAFVAGGANFIDTADGYSAWAPGHSGGESETLIGEWMAARGTRDQVVVATKVATHPEFKGLAAANVKAAADASLARLGIDEIDLYYAHFDDPETPIAETAAAFSELVDAGKVRAIALSNYTAERIDEWVAAARENGLHLPVALQPRYNLMDRGFETNGLRRAAEDAGLSVYPYYALARGFLTGKYREASDTTVPGASPRAQAAGEYLDERGLAVLAALDEIAAVHGAEVGSVALAWLREQPTVGAPIASARSAEQLRVLLASMSLELDRAELDALTAASA